MNRDIITEIKGGLIVSCQALENEPLHGSTMMGKMALAAKLGGAVGIRSNSVEDICEIRKKVSLPIIGIIKKDYSNSDIYITPTQKEVEMLINSPCDIIAFDATSRKRPDNLSTEKIIEKIKSSGKIAMADISTFEEGMSAFDLGVQIISTTLSGYTPYSKQISEPDFELVERLCKNVNIPVIAEGRVKTPEQLIKCFELGAHSVVVGGAITRPQQITESFTNALKRYRL